jgi:predicted O-methyltransferase YrrM
MTNWLKTAGKRASGRVFQTFQGLGLDVLPRHFYSEIPDIAKLRRSAYWREPYSMIGVNGADVDEHLAFARAVLTDDVRRELAAEDVHAHACAENGEPGYGRVEADVLYGVIRTLRPARIVQIGSGVSTAVILRAAERAGYRPAVVAVDPFPTDYLRRTQAAGKIELIARPVEALGWEPLLALGPGDLFFVDSTHTLGPAGEVTRIILEMLPRLEAGVLAHFHDIYFPYDYPTDILDGALFFSHESPLLHAYLANNPRMTMLASLAMLHHQRAAALAALVASYRPRPMRQGLSAGSGHFPSSVYLKVLPVHA